MDKIRLALAVALAGGFAQAQVYDLQPGADLVAALAEAKAAYDASPEPAVLRLAKGDYPLSEILFLNWPVTICGATGDAEDVVVRPTGQAFGLHHADALVHSLTVYGGKAERDHGGVIRFARDNAGNAGNGGTVSNVVVEACTGYPGQWTAAIVDVTPINSGKSALVTHCKIVSNSSPSKQRNNGNNRGAILWASDCATVRNTLIMGNSYSISRQTTAVGETASVVMGNGTMVNCSIISNKVLGTGADTGCAGVKVFESGRVVNTLICGNTNALAPEHYTAWCGTGANFLSCAMDLESASLPSGEGCVSVSDPKFLTSGDYRLTADSPCRDVGLVSSDYDYGTTDLYGAARIRGGKIDIGAYQFDPDGSHLSATQTLPASLFDRAEVAFAATVAGALGASTVYYWDFDSDGVTDLVTDKASFTHSLGLGTWRATVCATNPVSGVGNRFAFKTGFSVTPHPVHYVDVNGKNPQPPYLTEATAATDIQSAIDVAEVGAEVRIAKGLYLITKSLNVTNDYTVVRGASGNPEDVVVRALTETKTRCMQVDAGPHALVHSLTLENGRACDGVTSLSYYMAGSVLNIAHVATAGTEVVYDDGKGGTVSNCVIRGGTFSGNYCLRSAGVFMHGPQARLTHCVVSNNTHSGSTWYGGYYMSATGLAVWNGARAEHCLVTGNKSTKTQYMQAAVVVGGEGSLLRYSTVVGNTSSLVGGVNVSAGGRFEKCVIAQNTVNFGEGDVPRRNVWGAFDCPNCNVYWPREQPDKAGRSVAELEQAPLVAASQTTNACDVALADVGLGAGTISASVGQMFVDVGAGVWMPSRRSPLIDVVPFGNETQMPACDLAGGNRRSGNGYDLGAFERQRKGLVITFR